MPPIVKIKKAMLSTSRSSAAPTIQQGIQAFGKISKSQVQSNGKSALGKAVPTETPLENASISIGSKKRKLETTDDSFIKQDQLAEFNTTLESRSPKHVSGAIEDHHDTPKSQSGFSNNANTTTPRKKRILRKSETETPTKGARSLLETLAFSSSSPLSSTSSPIAKPQGTPPSLPLSAESPSSCEDAASTLPEELQDLINLHSSFLTVLSFHYAHNGSMTPADLRNLVPGLERAWRRRKPTTDDIRRILALERSEIQNGKQKASPLHLSNYGHGKICVEIAVSHHSQNAQRRPLNEEALNTLFFQNLEREWTSYKTNHPPNPSPTTFISTLPLLSITPCSSLSKLTPHLSKGQRRLEDLKAGAIKAQQSPLKAINANTVSSLPPKAKPTGARSIDLFSRLKAKQIHQSTLPLPPSTELLARKSALQRLPDIAPVLASLAASSNKHCDDDASAEGMKSRITHASFTMPTVVQHLQMSLRNPVGREEAGRCVRLLAEVVPECVGVRDVGRVVSVTVRGPGVGREELGRRIGELSG